MTRLSRKAATLVALFCAASIAFAARTNFNGYSDKVCIDLPEGFKLENSNSDTSFQLQSTIAPVHAIIQIYKEGKYKGTEDALNTAVSKLGLTADLDTFMWRNNTTAISLFTGNLMGVQSSGYGAAAVIPENKSIILVLTWAAEKDAQAATPYMTSLIDSIYVDIESYFSAGLLTSYTFPKKGAKDIILKIDGKDISTKIDESDKEASEFLISREYQVLLMYQKSDLWKEAWQRYYRLIFRDSSERLLQAGFDITNTLAPDCKDTTELAQKLLTWTQGFKYEREKTTSDFASLPSILLGSGSDCDSRSMLIAVLLQGINADSIIFVSAEYSHAIAGLVSDHPGFGFTVNGKLYLTGETTAKGITWGKIDGKQSDYSKWIPVALP
ncbi:hypothetical protein [Treponema sp.]|uniref:hypothetical protein n=1 Tax=Treponema sp. TaxID=166 RepID=UPI00298EB8C0|nr:hypothetical protein [Treponema sp.]MCQ2241288.1 hypothetical protein [Treponema sp.]